VSEAGCIVIGEVLRVWSHLFSWEEFDISWGRITPISCEAIIYFGCSTTLQRYFISSIQEAS
jgi:hypothetical protein